MATVDYHANHPHDAAAGAASGPRWVGNLQTPPMIGGVRVPVVQLPFNDKPAPAKGGK
jgi:hypothetical protein